MVYLHQNSMSNLQIRVVKIDWCNQVFEHPNRMLRLFKIYTYFFAYSTTIACKQFGARSNQTKCQA